MTETRTLNEYFVESSTRKGAKHRTAVNYFIDFAGDIPISEIAEQDLVEFLEWMLDAHSTLGRMYVRDMRSFLRCICREACPDLWHTGRRTPRKTIKRAKRKPLAKYTFEEYVDTVYFKGKQTPKKYRQAVQRWHDLFPDTLMEDIDEEELTAFTKGMVDQFGVIEATATKYCCYIRKIVRHLLPGNVRDWKTSVPRSKDPSTLMWFFEHEYRPKKPKITSPKTVKHYITVLSKFSLFLGRSAVMGDLTDDSILAFALHSRDVEELAIPTCNQRRHYLNAMMTWCAKRRLIESFPTNEELPEPRRSPEAWTIEQIDAIMQTCARRTGTFSGIPASEYWTSTHLWWYHCGARWGETLNGAFFSNLKNGSLHIAAEYRKGGKEPRTYRLPAVVLESIERIREPRRRLIWPWEQSNDEFYAHYRKLIEDSGLEYVKFKTGPHKFRRSHASHLDNAGGNAAKSLGHSNPRITQRCYLDELISPPDADNELLPPIRSYVGEAG